MTFTKIDQYFEAILCVDAVNKYNYFPEAYVYAAETLKVSSDEIIMVAAHRWDITGAAHIDMKTAIINRPFQSVYPLAKQPAYNKNDILLLAKKLI